MSFKLIYHDMCSSVWENFGANFNKGYFESHQLHACKIDYYYFRYILSYKIAMQFDFKQKKNYEFRPFTDDVEY